MANRARKAKRQQAQERARKKTLKKTQRQAKRRRSGLFALPGMVPRLPEGASEPPDGYEEGFEEFEESPGDARRAVESILRGMLGVLGGAGAEDTPLAQAQGLVDEAFQSRGPKRLRLAQEAMEICPDCADAYVLLAQQAPTAETALSLYRQGVAAGERALGKRAFKRLKGHFWLDLETRPYMRAREELARALWQAGSHDEAISHYRDLLQLNPNDNQGIRYVLASALVERERDDELAALLRQYEDDASADWAYVSALLAFRKEGDSPRARKLLEAAHQVNEHVPAYLLGEKRVPRKSPGYLSRGDPTEAISHAVGYARGWRDTPGALTWLRQTLGGRASAARPPRRHQGHDAAAGVAELPRAEEVWQVDIRRIPMVDLAVDRNELPWVVWVVDGTGGQIVAMPTSPSRPSPSAVWEHLAAAMLHPEAGDPRRPSAVEVRLKSVFNQIADRLEEVDVDCQLVQRMDKIDEVLLAGSAMARRMAASAENVAESDLAGLPQNAGEVWQADVRLLAAWVGGENAPQRPWCVLVSNRSDDLVLRHDLMMEPPEPACLWKNLATAMARPAVGQAHRPGVVEVVSPQQHGFLEPCLERIGVRCVVRDDLDHLDLLYREVAGHLDAPNRMTALVEVPGVTLEQVGELFEAAAAFYRKRPWRDVSGDTPVRVECEGLDTRLWHAVIMGQMGMTQGVALYDDAEALAEMLRGEFSDRENLRRTSGISLLYNEAFEIAPADLAAAEKYGWPVAGPEAYPGAVSISPGGAVRSPLAWEIELLSATLRALPEFLQNRQATLETTAPTASLGLTLRLSWPEKGAF